MIGPSLGSEPLERSRSEIDDEYPDLGEWERERGLHDFNGFIELSSGVSRHVWKLK